MRRRTPLVCLAALAAVAAACAHAPSPSPTPGVLGVPWLIPAPELGTQRVFRLRYDGPDGDGGLRLVLRLESAERFRLAASDSLAGELWTLQHDPSGVLALDHRRRRACDGAGSLAFDDLAPYGLTLGNLPAVLLGRVPVEPFVPPKEGSRRLEIVDAESRVWAVTVGDSGPVGWTMSAQGSPMMWWRRDRDEAVLSLRSGLQFRWQERLAEPLIGPLPALSVPAGYERVACDDDLPQLREDQPPPPGGGPAS